MEETIDESVVETIEESTELVYYIQVEHDKPILVIDPYVRYMLFGIVIIVAALAVHNIFKHFRGVD